MRGYLQVCGCLDPWKVPLSIGRTSQKLHRALSWLTFHMLWSRPQADGQNYVQHSGGGIEGGEVEGGSGMSLMILPIPFLKKHQQPCSWEGLMQVITAILIKMAVPMLCLEEGIPHFWKFWEKPLVAPTGLQAFLMWGSQHIRACYPGMTFPKSLQVQLSLKLESFCVLKNGSSSWWERHPRQAQLTDPCLSWIVYVKILTK